MLGTIKCTLGLWHEVRPLKPPLSSDWLAANTSQLSLVEAGGLALAKEPPDKMQGASNVQPDGWSLWDERFTGLLSDRRIFFMEHISFLDEKGQGLVPPRRGTHDPGL